MEQLLMNETRDRIKRWLASGRTLTDLALAAGICRETLSKIHYGETRSPHLRTISKIAEVLDLVVEIQRPNFERVRRIR
jgi:transcriptional regulator with XRE-family HTH domain